MATETFNLADVPDLSDVFDDTGASSEPFADGWYAATIEKERRFTDRNGNERVFESVDIPSANGASRNLRLQVEITRASDKRTLGTSFNINYRPEDLSQETVQAILQHKEAAKDTGEKVQWGELFRPFMTLQRLGKLQKIAGVRSFQRTEEGGLDVSGVFGKKVYVKLGADNRNPQYKEVKDISPEPPKRLPLL